MRHVLSALFVILFATSAAATSVVFQSSAPTAQVGEQVNVNLLLQDASNVYGYEVVVEFDPEKLSFVQLNPGPALSDNGKMSTFVLQPDLRKIGTVKNIVETRTGPVLGFDGSGTIRTLQFLAKAPGDAYLRIPSLILSDNAGNAIPGTIGQELHINIGGAATSAPQTTNTPYTQTSVPNEVPPTAPQTAVSPAPQTGGWISPPGNTAPGSSPQPIQTAQQNTQLQQQAPPQGTPRLVAQDTPVIEDVPKSQMNIEGPFTMFLGIAVLAALGIGGYAFLRARKGDMAKRMGNSLLGGSQDHQPAIDYFRQMRMRGYGEQEIVTQLKRSGWSDERIQQARFRAR